MYNACIYVHTCIEEWCPFAIDHSAWTVESL